MSTPFSRTLRSVESDRGHRHTIGLLTSTALLSIWFAWFLFGQIAVYEVTDRAHLEVEVRLPSGGSRSRRPGREDGSSARKGGEGG
jgi:hypothetical protein